MPSNTREIKRRIKAVSNTKKITKAMELVAAAKMRRTTQSVVATRTYSNIAWQIIQELAEKGEQSQHPLLKKTNGSMKKIVLLLISSNRGLSGSFNRDIVERAKEYLEAQKHDNPGLVCDIVLFGKKGKSIKKGGYTIVAEFDKPDVSTESRDVTPVASILIKDFLSGTYDKVAVCYTDFVSMLKQEPSVVELLPLGKPDSELGSTVKTATAIAKKNVQEYLYEPSQETVLQEVLQRLVELQVFQALLESNASEHSARMMAMRNASDAATDMISDLTFIFNQARQEAITTELADISGGRAALED